MTSKTQRRPVWLPIVVYLVLMPTMLWLGFWQLDKSQRQTERIDSFAAAEAAPADAQAVAEGALEPYQRIAASGRFRTERQVLVDNIVRGGRNGFFVITPFELNDGSTLLVNRGWIPQTPTRQPIGDLVVDGEQRTVLGRVGALPVGGIKLGDDDPAGDTWPRILQFPTIAAVAKQLEQPLAGWVLLLDAATPDGFVRDWRPGGLPPERHLGYAVQWFAMALALTILAIVVAVKRPGEQEE